jgi:hypothetical protein
MAGAIHPVAVEDDPLRCFRAPGYHCPIDATARKIVDLAGRQAPIGDAPIYCGATRHRPIEDAVQRTAIGRAATHCLLEASEARTVVLEREIGSAN